MKQGQSFLGHTTDVRNVVMKGKISNNEDFVLEKSIFNNVFEKDIRRVFIYKKTERLAKALHLIAPAFRGADALHDRIIAIGIRIVDAAIRSSEDARTELARELLALSSVLSVARTSGLLSPMNADLIARETHLLLQEIAEYEEPRLTLDETPTLAGLVKEAVKQDSIAHASSAAPRRPASQRSPHIGAGEPSKHIKDISHVKDNNVSERREAILSVIKNKRQVRIKDISAHIRNVSEKTIQRELLTLIELGVVKKEGERRWSVYSLA
ncbi:DeoR family transcriptional regulator [Patescibacteria group bacterium]|nr:DeoR family transcriptional regulator [Patescibacteria group bacterium]